MGTGYQRADISNSISNGEIVDADVLDLEYDTIEAAFNATTGHTHDGTTAEGGPITKTGPNQEFTHNASWLEPSLTNTLDIGSTSKRFKDAWFQGEVTSAGGFAGDLTGNLTGNVLGDVQGNLIGNVTGNLTGDVVGDLTGNVLGNLTGNVVGDLTGNVVGDLTGNASTANRVNNSLAAGASIVSTGDFDGSASRTFSVSSTSSRVSVSTTDLLQAKALNDHNNSGDHDARYTQRSNNLSDINNAALARANLGLGSVATLNTGADAGDILTVAQADNKYLEESNNLSDLLDAVEARSNLGLGSAATADVGTGPSNVPNRQQADGLYVQLQGLASIERVDVSAPGDATINFQNTTAPANQDHWRITAGQNTLSVQTLDGNYSNPQNAYVILRSGANTTSHDFFITGALEGRIENGATPVSATTLLNAYKADQRYAQIGSAWPGVYTGNDPGHLHYPIGTTLLVRCRNISNNTYVALNNDGTGFSLGPGASTLAGTWACRGNTMYNDHGQLFQRVA